MPSASGKAQLFVDRDYGGDSVILGEGIYNIGDSTGKVGNDTVSSLTVAPGYSVVAYLDRGLKGEKIIFTENTPYVGDQYNDRISSVSVKANSYLSTKLSNFPPQGDIYQLAGPVDLEDVNNPGPVLATIQAFPVTVNPPG
jgi:hypothetical protein